MKKWLKWLPLVVVVAFVGTVWAQTNNNYTCLSTTVSSSSSPVAIATPAKMTTWNIHVRSTPSADPVLVWPYQGNTVPTAVPTTIATAPGTAGQVMERPSGSDWQDAVTCNVPTCQDAIGEGWVAVLASGSTLTTVDFCYR